MTGKWGRGRNFPNFDFLENFLLTNVDRNDIIDKLFRTTEMIEEDSEKEK